MEIKDYYKYYLGCEVHAKEGTMTYTLRQLGDDGNFALFKDKHGNEMWLPPNEWKMCLRRLSSITEEEAKYILDNYTFREIPMPLKEKEFAVEIAKRLSEQMSVAHYLISRGFWLFGDRAFKTGLIIEKK